MKRYEIFIKSTVELKKREINRIIGLKQQHWHYDYQSQKNWFSNNIADDDLHVLVYKDKRLIAYLNAVWLNVKINNERLKVLGIGNVCVSNEFKNLGVGTLLMSAINVYLNENDVGGLLLCKDKLTGFYKRTNWQSVNAELFIDDIKFSHCIFAYNLKCNIDEIKKIEFPRAF